MDYPALKKCGGFFRLHLSNWVDLYLCSIISESILVKQRIISGILSGDETWEFVYGQMPATNYFSVNQIYQDMKIATGRIFQLMKSKAGAPPGTLLSAFGQSETQTTIKLLTFRDEHYETVDDIDYQDLPKKISGEATNWIQFTGLGDVAKLEEVGKVFGISQLVLEDILNTEHLPKTEETDGQLFFVIKLIERNQDTDELEVNHVCLLLAGHYIISFVQHPTRLFDSFIQRIAQGAGKIRQRTSDYILYRLIDIIVDHYYLLFNQTDEKLQAIEEVLMDGTSADMTKAIQIERKELNFLRRNILLVADAMRQLMKNETPIIKKQHRSYFSDISDHLNHLASAAEQYREMIAGLLELQMMNNSNRMNSVMKSLTVIATIFIPLTFLAGIYGMNFEYMPELTFPWAYPAILLIMFGIGVGMYLYMRQKKWF